MPTQVAVVAMGIVVTPLPPEQRSMAGRCAAVGTYSRATRLVRPANPIQRLRLERLINIFLTERLPVKYRATDSISAAHLIR
jgi:hypothetical protein